MPRNPRDHGYGYSPKVIGAPRVLDRLPKAECPNCMCTTLFTIEVEVQDPPPTLRRPPEPHQAIGMYVGCPACPWASPMTITTRKVGGGSQS